MTAHPRHRRPLGAVIIPAHNEETVIARTLAPLASRAASGELEVIVVANACHDDTAGVARRFIGVRVIEVARGSKPNAMNVGDAIVTAWPRLYLDADIEIDPAAVTGVFGALDEPGVLAARPCAVYDTDGAVLPVRAYYRARMRIPDTGPRLWGAGGYAVSRKGHERFGAFAEVTADDSWFDGRFTAEEKRVVDTPPMRVRTARDVPALLAVLSRQRRGCVELGLPATTSARGSALLRGIRGPVSALDVACYALLTLLSRRSAARATGAGTALWERDGSSRERVLS
ncbi:glycosyltransferase family 2 protein [Microbacteriaceae bacterium VKM Ac-2855]|nr:glycosyltransferase family 2 protein [Microbacteriaceae bacterium VKM Ac-2855]